MRRIALLVICIVIVIGTVSAKVIATATLRVTLTVPAPPITAETEEGDYGEYAVEKTDSCVYVTAK